MFFSFRRILQPHRRRLLVASTTSTVTIGLITGVKSFDVCRRQSKSGHGLFEVTSCLCDSARDSSHLQQAQHQGEDRRPRPVSLRPELESGVRPPSSFWSRLVAHFGILSLPRLLTPSDPAFKISKRFLRKRRSHEEKIRKIVVEDVPKLTSSPDFEKKMALWRQEIFELLYGKGVTAQMREDFLIRYGCSGFNENILRRLVELFATHGLVEVGAGHGQWQKALTDAYGQKQFASSRENSSGSSGDGIHRAYTARGNTEGKKKFDFVLAYDNNSDLPLNTHIYNQYTQPHHEYFGCVKKVDSNIDLERVLRSWSCRGRALLIVYPPPGSMAIDVLKIYTDAAPENNMLIYVGEGRGGANGDEAFFDFLEHEGWILIDIMEVLRPPGDKGCEKLYILKKIKDEI